MNTNESNLIELPKKDDKYWIVPDDDNPSIKRKMKKIDDGTWVLDEIIYPDGSRSKVLIGSTSLGICMKTNPLYSDLFNKIKGFLK